MRRARGHAFRHNGGFFTHVLRHSFADCSTMEKVGWGKDPTYKRQRARLCSVGDGEA